MASTHNMPFNLNMKVKMEPIEEIIIKYYIIEFHQKMDCLRLKIKQLLNRQWAVHWSRQISTREVTGDFTSKYYFTTKLYLIFIWITLTWLLKTKLTFLLSRMRLLVLKMLNWIENKNHWIIKFLNFCSTSLLFY